MKNVFVTRISSAALFPQLAFCELSWRDIIPQETTEKELLKISGEPSLVEMKSSDYFLIRKGREPEEVVLIYVGYIGEEPPRLMTKLPFAPSRDIGRVESWFKLKKGIVSGFGYKFSLFFFRPHQKSPNTSILTS